MTMTIDTLSGIKTVSLVKMNGEVQMATVDMGPALLSPASIPAKFGGDRIVSEPITVGGEEYRITCVSMGLSLIHIFRLQGGEQAVCLL